MKILFWLLSIAVILFVGSANGANGKRYMTRPTPTPTPLPTPPPPPPEVSVLSRHFYVGALYDTSNALQMKGNLPLYGSNTPFTATQAAAAAGGFTAGYRLRHADSWGFSGDLTYELPRTSTGVEGSAGNLAVHGTYDQDPSTILVTTAVNANYSIGERLYLQVGINYPLTVPNQGGESLTGLPGYQGGLGYAWSDRITTEFDYRVVRLKGSINSPPLTLEIDQATLSGCMLAVHYSF